MRCFPKFYSWDCFVRLHYEVIISTDVISFMNILDRSLRYVISLDQTLCLRRHNCVTAVWCAFLHVM